MQVCPNAPSPSRIKDTYPSQDRDKEYLELPVLAVIWAGIFLYLCIRAFALKIVQLYILWFSESSLVLLSCS